MDLRIDEQVISDAIESAATKALTEGIGSWQTAHDLRAVVEKAMADLELPRRMGERLAALVSDRAAGIVEAVAVSAIPAIQRAMAEAVHAQMAALIVAVRAGGEYLTPDQRRVLIEKTRLELSGNQS